MKLLVFAHTPPPHHGQSYMVKLMLEGLGGDVRRRLKSAAAPLGIECYHVNARFSDDMEDIGSFRVTKALLVFRYCVEAIWCRFRHGVRAFYYVPAPGKRAALYRDWMVMILCRPFFRDFIHHWHAAGLGDWLRREGTAIERWLTHRLLGHPTLGLTLAVPGMRDALWFRSRQVEIVANGIPDPCPDFDTVVLPRRRQRLAARRALLAGETVAGSESGGATATFRVLYIAHCMREKGLFDAIDGTLRANEILRTTNSPLRIHLTVAGLFPFAAEEAEFQAYLRSPHAKEELAYAGFVGGEEKRVLLQDSDCLCFPTYYHAESFGLVVVEAMAAGMEVITTRWRAIPEILPADHPGFVPVRAPEAVAAALVQALTFDHAAQLRHEFVTRFTEARYLQTLREALSGISPVSIPAS
jgi:glycosyltransferase involved in cell wall biosynthesis